MIDTSNWAEQRRIRHEAAERQGWLCYLCGVRMADRRVCEESRDRVCQANIYHDPHAEITAAMPRFGSGYLRTGNPHVASLRIGDETHAAHLSCVNSYHSTGKQEVLRLGDLG